MKRGKKRIPNREVTIIATTQYNLPALQYLISKIVHLSSIFQGAERLKI